MLPIHENVLQLIWIAEYWSREINGVRTSAEIHDQLLAAYWRGHLRFPAAEVKNASDLEFPLMPESVKFLDIYLSDWHPLLITSSPTSFLFPGKGSDLPKGTGALSGQIRDLVHAYTRLDMPAHRFRHAVAKIFLDRNPGQYEVVRQLLGHKDIATTISFYAGAESASAARHYAKTILGIRGRDDD